MTPYQLASLASQVAISNNMGEIQVTPADCIEKAAELYRRAEAECGINVSGENMAEAAAINVARAEELQRRLDAIEKVVPDDFYDVDSSELPEILERIHDLAVGNDTPDESARAAAAETVADQTPGIPKPGQSQPF